MALVKFDKEKKDAPLRPGFNDVFESFFPDVFSERMLIRVPGVNISETDDQYLIELAAPGLKKSDFMIRLDDNVLSVSVEQKQEDTEKNRNYSKREYSFSSFVRSFALPEGADDQKIDASYNDGVLMIKIPKKEEAKSVSREIKIK